MFETKVQKYRLIQALENNKSQHVATFERAWGKFKTAYLAEAERQLDEFKVDRIVRIAVGMIAPQNHKDDYETVLGLLAMSNEDTITLSDDDYRQYVLDDWDWKQQWTLTNSSYIDE